MITLLFIFCQQKRKRKGKGQAGAKWNGAWCGDDDGNYIFGF